MADDPRWLNAARGTGVAALFAALLATSALAGDLPAVPDPRLTPGAIATTDRDAVCAPGYSRSHRTWHDKRMTLRRYGLRGAAAPLVEDDDLVPICAGGDNASPLNHWPQPLLQAYIKDRIEAAICYAVCRRGMSLDTAQRYFLGLGWLPETRGDDDKD